MKSVRCDLPATIEQAMAMPGIVQVHQCTLLLATRSPQRAASHCMMQALTAWANQEAGDDAKDAEHGNTH
jgi:hypothetical protein